MRIAAKTSVKYLGCVLDESLGGEGMALQVLGKVNGRTVSCQKGRSAGQ